MVRLTRIYTRGGDKGQTSLGDGSRVAKHDLRVEAYGTVDEANAALGLVRLHTAQDPEMDALLARLQNDLFDLGADLCTPGDGHEGALRIQKAQVERLEAEIDAANEKLKPLDSFILPGGTAASSHLHLARTVTRRAERLMAALALAEPLNPQALAYANRLSDLLFVLARAMNQQGEGDILWVPGKNR
ncbi:MAG: cob(I)yrinic acid a,c-diamide adenosyltransferase [Rhodospirillales bacterium]|jgi:cob(I)alamin adenosyltransferase|nr:cob(I)yrinic acid a,c-diamide adenosyltransferase [Rhodospirillales bacterium]